jgi:ribonuclease III
MSITPEQSRLFAALGWTKPPQKVLAALTHPSFRNEAKGVVDDYERLEFLGDAVLQLCVSERLAEAFPKASEGELSRMRAALVCTDSLADFARKVRLAEAIRAGRGARASGEHDRTNVLADVVEALVGAAYLDGGLESARALVDRVVEGRLHDTRALDARDAKSRFQERVQAEGRTTPRYQLEASGGVDLGRWFEVGVFVDDELIATGRGSSKKLAEQAAARRGLAVLDHLEQAPSSANGNAKAGANGSAHAPPTHESVSVLASPRPSSDR